MPRASRMVGLSSTARTRIGASAGESRSVHLNGDGIAKDCAYERCDAVKKERTADSNVRQRTNLCTTDAEIEGQRVDSDRHIHAGLPRRVLPARLAEMGGGVATGLAGGVGDHGVGEIGPRHVEGAE